MQVGGVGAEFQIGGLGEAIVVRGFAVPDDAGFAFALGFVERFLAPGAGDDVLGGFAGAFQQVQREHVELQAGTALEKENLIAGGHAQQFAQALDGFGEDGIKGLLRWLISKIDMPTPGSAISSRWACSRTGSGRTAGPGEKLKTRSGMEGVSGQGKGSGIDAI